MITQVKIPIGRPLTFRELRELNPGVTTDDLITVFQGFPKEMQEEAWSELRLRTQLDDWNAFADPTQQ